MDAHAGRRCRQRREADQESLGWVTGGTPEHCPQRVPLRRRKLRTAHDMLTGIGMQGFADRARHELAATGEKLRRRIPGTRDELSPQEEQIARLARDGLSNPEIGAQLFISARTVEWHLRHVFDKLGIGSRKELRTALKDSRLLTGS